MGFIYLIWFPNSNNKKQYVGQTTKDIETRRKGHIQKARMHQRESIATGALQNAINKYGPENMEMEELQECPEELLNEREKYWIKYLNTLCPYGYNLQDGGANGRDSEQTRKHKCAARAKLFVTWRENMLPYEKAKDWIHKSEYCGCTNREFKAAYRAGKIPKNIPLSPHEFYPEWESWQIFLKNNNKRNEICSLDEFFEYSRANLTHIKSQKEYKIWSKTDKRPRNIPVNPGQIYGEEFKKRGGWDYAFNRKLFHLNCKIPIDEIQKKASKLGLLGAHAYYAWHSKNKDKPEFEGWMRHPNRYPEWKEKNRNWYWFLGNKNRRGNQESPARSTPKKLHNCECGYMCSHHYNFKRHLRLKKHKEKLK